MQKLNSAATEIFSRLLDKTEKKYQTELKAEGFQPLVIVRMAAETATPYGEGKLYSFYQYTLSEYDRDRMYDPEMWFLVIDNRTDATDYANLSVYPIFYQVSALGICQYAADPEDYTLLNATMQAKQARFASGWMLSLENMGFLQ